MLRLFFTEKEIKEASNDAILFSWRLGPGYDKARVYALAHEMIIRGI